MSNSASARLAGSDSTDAFSRCRKGTGRAALIASVAAVSLGSSIASAAFDPVEKSIGEFHTALTGGQTTVAQVAQIYVDRINAYNKSRDLPGVGFRTGLNAIAEVNSNWATEAAAIDALIAGGATTAQYPLLGVPVIVKNSYDAVGMATNNGVSVLNKDVSGANTPGSTTLKPTVDSFSVAQLRAAGALILGKAGQTTMAYSYNGIDNSLGQIRNPYNPNRTPGGSSSGTGSGIAANLAMAGMGGETGGSIRVPASANSLVGLKTSIGIVDPRGTWPLTPSRDVVGPLTRTVKDAAIMMNALVGPSPTNLFNGTPFYLTNAPGTVRPADYTAGLTTTALQGKVLAIPKSMANLPSATATTEGTINSTVLAQFNTAVDVMKAQGATVIYVDIPASTKYYNTIGRSSGATTAGLGYDYPTTTVGGTTPSNTWSGWAAAYYYNELIKSYNDPVIKNLRDFHTALVNGSGGLAGSSLSTLNGAAGNVNTLANTLEAGNAKGFGDADNEGNPDNPDAIRALKAFSDLQKNEFEGFMNAPNLTDDPTTVGIDESTITKIDAFIAPTYGTVQATVPVSQRLPNVPLGTYNGGSASLLARLESNILGGPSLSVPMGYFDDGTPMGVQFFAEMLSEHKLLQLGYAYEQASNWRSAPNLDLLVTVPEPSTLGALAGVTVLALRRRRFAFNA